MASVYLLNRLSVEQENDNLHIELSPVGIEAEPDQDGWRSLFNGYTLDGWEITNFGPQGPVLTRDSSIILNYGDGCTGVTWQEEFPTVNYEIKLEAMRVDGNDFFCGLTFPVIDEYCTFIVGGWAGSLVGISSIDGADASQNFTTIRIPFENGRWYHIRVKVTDKVIRCFIDDGEVVTVPVAPHSFTVRSEVGLSRPLGIASWVTTSALRNIKFREI